MKKIFVQIIGAILLLTVCGDRVTDAPKENQPPETRLFLLSDNDLATSTREVTRILNNRLLQPTSARPTLDTLRIGTVVTFVKEVVPKPTATVLYRLQTSTEWRGRPVLAVEDATHAFVFSRSPFTVWMAIATPAACCDGFSPTSLGEFD